MSHIPSARMLNVALAIVFGLSLSACVVQSGPPRAGYVYPGPPASVVYFDYWYYPDVQVYFDTGRGLYFYYSNNRWIETRVLPPYWRARLGAHVRIHSRYNRPYIEHGAHSRNYPPPAPKKYRIPEYRDRTSPPSRDIHDRPRTPPPQERGREHREDHDRDRYQERYQPKAPVVKQPGRQRYVEPPRSEPRSSEKSTDNKRHENSDNRYRHDNKRDSRKPYDPKGKRDDRDEDR